MWEDFGLQKNPFDNKPVEREGLIPIDTFVGREDERHSIKKIIETSEHSLSLIVGAKGVGKTSLGNVIRSDLFEHYFTTINPIDCQHEWTSKDVITDVLGNFYETIELVKTYQHSPEKYLSTCDSIKKELKPLFEEEGMDLSVNLAGIGGGYGSSKFFSRAPLSVLKTKFRKVIDIIRGSGYKGVIIQIDNLDNIELNEMKLAKVLSDLRDFLVSDYCHFIFLGDKGMEASFKVNSKVHECISKDVQIGSFSAESITKILEKRYNSFLIPGRNVTEPVTPDAVKLLCSLYEGNIRQVFYSLTHAVLNSKEVLGRTQQLNSAKLEQVLFKIASERLKDEVQPKAFGVLLLFINSKEELTNTDISKKLKLKNQNTSKYLKQLKDSNLIIATSQIGRNVYYKPVHEAKWLLLRPEPGRQLAISDFS
jgi:hypothetical protein